MRNYKHSFKYSSVIHALVGITAILPTITLIGHMLLYRKSLWELSTQTKQIHYIGGAALLAVCIVLLFSGACANLIRLVKQLLLYHCYLNFLLL
jgi:hypothetical protein